MGAYTNSPQVLIRYDVTSPDDKYLSLVLSQYNKTRDIAYTMSVLCTQDFVLSPPVKDLPHSVAFGSQWTAETAGGPIGRPGFSRNPMFAVEVPKGGSSIEIRISTTKSAAVNALLVPVKKYRDRVDRNTGKPVIDTAKYRFGFVASRRQHVGAGPYVLICSNFHAGQQAVFEVKVMSSVKVKIEKI